MRVRLRPADRGGDPLAGFDAVAAKRQAEADEFYAELTPAAADDDEALVLRQALAGMLWSKQLYAYDVARWLDGDPTQPVPPASRLNGRNAHWRTFDAFDIMSMPDKWEYPWFAAWDLAFHCVALARVDPAFAKYQLILLCREWFQHPNGALAAYEWSFDDVNPPVQAWAALEVFAIDGGRDVAFLSRIFDKLLVNFTWWVNRLDADGSNIFEGGFLGLDNIGPIDRSHLAPGQFLEQSDGTGWMGFYALSMAAIASILTRRGRPATDLVLKFLEHFALISEALESQGLWDETDGFFYDQLRLADGRTVAIKVRSIVGVLPLLGVVAVDEAVVERAEIVNKKASDMLRVAHPVAGVAGRATAAARRRLGCPACSACFEKLFDESEFLSPYGLRAVSRWHEEHPFELEIDGVCATIDYEPAESTTGLFGGNSNWRGPIWMPVNLLVIEALRRYARFFGDELKVEYPTGSGKELTLEEIADDLADAADVALPRRRGRAASLLRLGRAAPDRSRMEGQPALQRVLPRRQRRRARCEPPDRLDGRDRRDRSSATAAGTCRRSGSSCPPIGSSASVTIRSGRRPAARSTRPRAREWLVADGARRLCDGNGRRAPDAALPRAARGRGRRARRTACSASRRSTRCSCSATHGSASRPTSGAPAPSIRAATSCSRRSTSRTAFRAGGGRSAGSCSSASSPWRTARRRSASSTG